MRKVMAAKLHGIYVTGAELNYHGSVTLDPDHCEAADIFPLEFVDIWNKNSGARISTYVILGERGSRCCILNGAAARTCQKGDEIIICSSHYIEANRIADFQPKILTFDKNNHIASQLRYVIEQDDAGRTRFNIVNEGGEPQPIPLKTKM